MNKKVPLIFLAILFLLSTVQAKSFSLEEASVSMEINPDGSVDVTEKITEN